MLKQKVNSQEATAIKKLFDGCKNVIIVSHSSPDGDAIGSSLAMKEYLQRKGKNVNVIVPNLFPDFLKWMNDADKIIIFERQKALSYNLFNMADLIVCLDFNVLTRIDEMGTIIPRLKAKKILIDHHMGPEKFADVTVSRPECSSASELVFRVLTAIGGIDSLNVHGAEDIYCGLYTDTGGFAFNSNEPDVFTILAELLRKGIDKDKINRYINNNFTADRFRLMGYVLQEKLMVFPELHASLYSLTAAEQKKYNYMKGDMEGVVNMPLSIKGHKLSISLREDTEKPIIWISVRSYDDVSAKDIAQQFFNGGGHFNAAGGRLENMKMEDAIEVAKKAIEAFREVLEP